jgi:hypothetical protein
MLNHPIDYLGKLLSTLAEPILFIPLVLLMAYFQLAGWRSSGDMLIVLAAPLAIRLFSLYDGALNYQYSAIFLPFIFVALVRRFRSVDLTGAKKLALFVLMLSIVGLAARSAPFHHPFSRVRTYLGGRENFSLKQSVVESLLSETGNIAAPNNWVPHLSDHAEVSTTAAWLDRDQGNSVDVWIWDQDGDYYPSKEDQAALKSRVITQIDIEEYYKEIAAPGVELWRRIKKS